MGQEISLQNRYNTTPEHCHHNCHHHHHHRGKRNYSKLSSSSSLPSLERLFCSNNTNKTPSTTPPTRSPSATGTTYSSSSSSSTSSSSSSDKQKDYLSNHLYIKTYLDIVEEDTKAKQHFKPARPGIRNYTPKILLDKNRTVNKKDVDVWI